MKSITRFLLAVSLISLTACSKQAGDNVSPDPGSTSSQQSGYVSGKVLDAQGKPIKGAEITVNNTGGVVNNLIGYSDSNGNYRIKLSTGGGPLIGSYYVRGHVTVNYLNYPFRLALFVEDDGAFAPEEGAVKNLRLKVAGPGRILVIVAIMAAPLKWIVILAIPTFLILKSRWYPLVRW